VVSAEDLGGGDLHSRTSGVTDHLAENDQHALGIARRIVGNLNRVKRPNLDMREPVEPLFAPDEIYGVVPADARKPYDVREIIARIVDGSEFDEFKQLYGPTLVTGFARIWGYPVGIVANNGILFSESAQKGAHFIELCAQRGIPLVFLQNITGFMVGTDAERGGIAKHSAKLVYAVSNARVPRYTVIIGGSYGAGNYGMCGRGFQPRFLFSWPNARIATMSADIAATVVTDLRRASLTRETADDAEIARVDRETRAQFEAQSTPYYATARLWDDGIIEPWQTRDVMGLCLALASREIDLPEHRPVYRM
jgi:3-methylcrotonyl-CoA carboxylase beta subunit